MKRTVKLNTIKPKPPRKTPTTWFPMNTNPQVKGVYELRMVGNEFSQALYSYWSGNHWGLVRYTPDRAEESGHLSSVYVKNGTYDAWRGVQEKPTWYKEEK